MPDVYYDPEHFDLEQVASVEDPDLSWEFDMVVVWRHTETGDLYWASDAGCSCFPPFYSYDSLSNLNRLDPAHPDHWRALEDEARSTVNHYGQDPTPGQERRVKDFLTEVRQSVQRGR